jgi:hypothetical protein
MSTPEAIAAKLYQNGSLEILKAELINEALDAIAYELHREEPYGIILITAEPTYGSSKAKEHLAQLAANPNLLCTLINEGKREQLFCDGSKVCITNAKDINPERKDPANIPLGMYCYVPREREPHEPANTLDGRPIRYIKLCPYYTTKEFNGVEVPWCAFLNQGGTEGTLKHGQTKEQAAAEWSKLVEHFGTEDKVHEALPLDLLFDQIKMCQVNIGRED